MTNRLETKSSANAHSDAYASPLSFAQERMWSLHQVALESSTNNILRAFYIAAALCTSDHNITALAVQTETAT